MDNYYLRGEVSNSDLSSLEKYFNPDKYQVDPTDAYRFGNLIDALITETDKVDFFKKTVSDYPDKPFTAEQWETALKMRAAFKKDSTCSQLLSASECQKKFFETVNLKWGSVRFSLRMRCKFDLWSNMLGWGGDIKSTRAMGSRTPFEILADLTAALRETGELLSAELRLWHEWEAGSKGRRQQVWSRGMRAKLGLGQELTDEEAAELEVEGEDLVAIDSGEWRRVSDADPGLEGQCRSIIRASSDMADARSNLSSFLAHRGVAHRLVWPVSE